MVDILNAQGMAIGRGVVSDQAVVHGRKLTLGWIPIMVEEIQRETKAWSEFPTHSNLVEEKSFVAWPKVFLKHVNETS